MFEATSKISVSREKLSRRLTKRLLSPRAIFNDYECFADLLIFGLP